MVCVSSPHADRAIPGSTAYNMAKAAVDQLSRTAACELSPHRIRVNIVHPGWTDTPGERKFFKEEELQSHGSKLPWAVWLVQKKLRAESSSYATRLASISQVLLCRSMAARCFPHDQMFRITDRPN